MKLNILHISHTDIRSDSRILKEMKTLSAMLEYNVIGFGLGERKIINNVLVKEIKVKAFTLYTKWLTERIKFLSRPIRYSSLMYFEIFIKMFFSGIFVKPRVIHCHDTLVLPIGVVLKIFTGAKLFYDAHELESQRNSQSKMLSKIFFFIERFSWRFVDVFISVSPSIIEWYESKLGLKENALILNSPVFDINVFDVRPNNYLREKYNIPLNEKVFIYIGIIGRGRGIDLYLDIFKLADVTSHIVFLGYGELVSKVKEHSESFRSIHYHPSVPHHEVVRIAKSADIGLAMVEAVSLSDYYCLPNKLFEYAFSGLFVITSDFPDMKRVVEEYDLGVTCSVDKDTLRELVEKVSDLEVNRTNKDLYKLSWQYQEKVLLNSYHKVLSLKN